MYQIKDGKVYIKTAREFPNITSEELKAVGISYREGVDLIGWPAVENVFYAKRATIIGGEVQSPCMLIKRGEGSFFLWGQATQEDRFKAYHTAKGDLTEAMFELEYRLADASEIETYRKMAEAKAV